MLIPASWFPYLNFAVYSVVIIFLVTGLYKGFLLMAVELFSLVLTLVASYFISPFLAARYDLASNFKIDTGIALLNDLIAQRMNSIIWFLIVFAALMVFFAILRSVIKVADDIPVVKQINRLLGGLFGIVKAYVLILLVIFVLTTPFIKNGKIVLNQSILGDIYEASSSVFQWFKEPTDFNQVLQNIVNNKTVKQKDLEGLMNWLQEKVDDTKTVTKVIDQLLIEEGE